MKIKNANQALHATYCAVDQNLAALTRWERMKLRWYLLDALSSVARVAKEGRSSGCWHVPFSRRHQRGYVLAAEIRRLLEKRGFSVSVTGRYVYIDWSNAFAYKPNGGVEDR